MVSHLQRVGEAEATVTLNDCGARAAPSLNSQDDIFEMSLECQWNVRDALKES